MKAAEGFTVRSERGCGVGCEALCTLWWLITGLVMDFSH